MFSRDSVVAERNWAVLVGVTTSGSHASTRWFKSFYEACQKRHIIDMWRRFRGRTKEQNSADFC